MRSELMSDTCICAHATYSGNSHELIFKIHPTRSSCLILIKTMPPPNPADPDHHCRSKKFKIQHDALCPRSFLRHLDDCALPNVLGHHGPYHAPDSSTCGTLLRADALEAHPQRRPLAGYARLCALGARLQRLALAGCAQDEICHPQRWAGEGQNRIEVRPSPVAQAHAERRRRGTMAAPLCSLEHCTAG